MTTTVKTVGFKSSDPALIGGRGTTRDGLFYLVYCSVGCWHPMLILTQRHVGSIPTRTASTSDRRVMLYRKKPVVVEANVFNGGADSATTIINWALSFDGTIRYHSEDDSLSINTLEGTMKASAGDMVIRGVSNEFYACKPDIFRLTYEELKK